MKIAIISGSVRKQSNSARTARYIERFLGSLHRNVSPWVLDLSTAGVPEWTESDAPNAEEAQAKWAPWSAELASSDGFVVIAPEWGGMVPPALKSLFLRCTEGELAHKPGFLIGVSSGGGGTYPLAELRMSSFKNTHICYIPEQIVLRQATQMLVDVEAPSSPEDANIRVRLHHGLDVLLAYAHALGAARAEATFDWRKFPYGM